MKVVELRELNRRNIAIHYIKEFTAIAVLQSKDTQTEAEIAFVLESKAVGPPEVSVRVLNPVDWPLLPVVRALRDHILELETSGRLN